MDIVKIGVLGITSVLMAHSLKYQKPEYSFFISMAVCMLIFFALLGQIKQILEYSSELSELMLVNEDFLNAILKMIGITYMAEFSSNLCKDAGYQAIAGQIEMFAKVSVLVLSMPVLFSFVKTVQDFI